MKPLNLITQTLLVIGGLNWGSSAYSAGTSSQPCSGLNSILSRLVYLLVGVSALWQFGRLLRRQENWRTAGSAA